MHHLYNGKCESQLGGPFPSLAFNYLERQLFGLKCNGPRLVGALTKEGLNPYYKRRVSHLSLT